MTPPVIQVRRFRAFRETTLHANLYTTVAHRQSTLHADNALRLPEISVAACNLFNLHLLGCLTLPLISLLSIYCASTAFTKISQSSQSIFPVNLSGQSVRSISPVNPCSQSSMHSFCHSFKSIFTKSSQSISPINPGQFPHALSPIITSLQPKCPISYRPTLRQHFHGFALAGNF